MKIRVHFHSGHLQDFVCSEDMLQSNFEEMASKLGGKIKKIEFL